MVTELIEYRNLIEGLFQVTRDNTGKVTSYGIMGKYTFEGSIENTAFTVGITPKNVIKVTGIELVLPYPTGRTINLDRQVFTEADYRLTIVIRDGATTTQSRNALLLLERSGYFDGFCYSFQDANPKVGNFPQWYCQWKGWIFRDIII